MKKITAAAVAALTAATVLVAPAATAAQPTTVTAAKSDYTKKKQERFWQVVTRYEPMVKYGGKKNTIALGIATCDLLRAGGDLYDLSLLLLESNAGIAEDSIMAIMAAAPVVLCPDQGYKFE